MKMLYISRTCYHRDMVCCYDNNFPAFFIADKTSTTHTPTKPMKKTTTKKTPVATTAAGGGEKSDGTGATGSNPATDANTATGATDASPATGGDTTDSTGETAADETTAPPKP